MVFRNKTSARGFEPPTYRLGVERSIKKLRKEAAFHITLFKNSLTYSLTSSSATHEAGHRRIVNNYLFNITIIPFFR